MKDTGLGPSGTVETRTQEEAHESCWDFLPSLISCHHFRCYTPVALYSSNQLQILPLLPIISQSKSNGKQLTQFTSVDNKGNLIGHITQKKKMETGAIPSTWNTSKTLPKWQTPTLSSRPKPSSIRWPPTDPQTEMNTSLVHQIFEFSTCSYYFTYSLWHFVSPSPLELHPTPFGLWVS